MQEANEIGVLKISEKRGGGGLLFGEEWVCKKGIHWTEAHLTSPFALRFPIPRLLTWVYKLLEEGSGNQKSKKMEREGNDEIPLHRIFDTRDHSVMNCRKSCNHCRYHEEYDRGVKIETALLAITCVFTIATFVITAFDWWIPTRCWANGQERRTLHYLTSK